MLLSPRNNGLTSLFIIKEVRVFKESRSHLGTYNLVKLLLTNFASGKTDPDQFERGFKATFSFLRQFSRISPIPERRKAACKKPIYTSKKDPFSKHFQLDRVSVSTPGN